MPEAPNEKKSIALAPPSGSSVIEDQDYSNCIVIGAKLERQVFRRIKFLETEVVDGYFKQCIFEDCYFRCTDLVIT
jgi:hypothetical protein